MKSLSQHNQDQRALEEFMRANAHKAGVSCDTCGTEMILQSPNVINGNGSQWVKCPKCGATGLMR